MPDENFRNIITRDENVLLKKLEERVSSLEQKISVVIHKPVIEKLNVKRLYVRKLDFDLDSIDVDKIKYRK